MPNVPALKFAHVRSMIVGQPLMVLPDHLQSLVQVIGPRIGIQAVDGTVITEAGQVSAETVDTMAGIHPDDAFQSGDPKPYDLVEGVAFIPVQGTIVHRCSSINAECGLTSTDALKHVMHKAFENPAVKALYLDINSPGGMVSGTFDAIDFMMEMKRHYKKKVFAHAGELAASAAYAIASVADHMSTPRTGDVGSVGVIFMHGEASKLYEQMGFNVTIFRRGERKAEVNGMEPLTEAAQAKIQSRIDETYELFVSSVVANRDPLTRDAVVGTQSALLDPAEAVRLGFIDAIMSEEQAFLHAVSYAS